MRRRRAIDIVSGTRRIRVGLIAAVALGVVAIVAPAPGRAAASTWTISLTPSTITATQPSVINATFSNLGGPDGQTELGCVRIAIPATLTVQTVTVINDPAGTTWHASKSGLTTVTINTGSGGDRLPPHDPSASVTTAIKVTAVLPGTYTWTANAYRAQDCSQPFNDPIGLQVVVDLDVLPLPTPTPKPLPTVLPTILPTAIPTLIPTPRPTPTRPPAATPVPTVTPAPTPSPQPADATATPTQAGGTSGPPTPPGSSGPSGTSDPEEAPTGTPAALGAGLVMPDAGPGDGGSGAAAPAIKLTSGFETPFGEGFAWAVPGLVLTVPGLLIVLAAIGAQLLGAFAWLPVVRRRIGAFGLRRRTAAGGTGGR